MTRIILIILNFKPHLHVKVVVVFWAERVGSELADHYTRVLERVPEIVAVEGFLHVVGLLAHHGTPLVQQPLLILVRRHWGRKEKQRKY